ncbi:MAG: IS30 family transposase [Microthrixaceae bacterium]
MSRLLTLNPKISWAEIGRSIERHPTTIAREVSGRGGRCRYRLAIADKAAIAARSRRRPRLAALSDTVRDRIRAELKCGRSPEAIWADLVADGVEDRPCVETIYTAVYAGALDLEPSECLRTRRPRRRSRQARQQSKRPALSNILLRPDGANDRTEAGHLEADQIIGARNRSSMLWLSERLTRFSIPVTMPEGYNGEQMLAGLIEGLDQIPQHLLRSITFDQGSECSE